MEFRKSSSMQRLPRTSVQKLEMFLDRLGFYRHFINNYSKFVHPFEILLKSETDKLTIFDKSRAFTVTRDVLDAFL